MSRFGSGAGVDLPNGASKERKGIWRGGKGRGGDDGLKVEAAKERHRAD